jgi:hypothetical protein
VESWWDDLKCDPRSCRGLSHPMHQLEAANVF